MAPSAAIASCAVLGARCGFLRCGVVMRRRNGRSSMSLSSYADGSTARSVRLVGAGAVDASTVAFTSPCVSLDSGM